MSKHEELIERLRCFDRVTCNEAADALEAQAREIEGLRKALAPFAAYEHVRSTMGGTTPKEGVLWGCHSRAGSAEITVEDMQAAIDAAKGAHYGIT